MRCPGCRAEVAKEQRFCTSCGAALGIVCPTCSRTNPPAAKFCASCGTSFAASAATPRRAAKRTAATTRAAAERRQLTLLFCDLVGSTSLSAKLDPEDLREIIAAYHGRCTEVIGNAGGFVAKYMGDGVLAYFGFPQAEEDAAEQAVWAGLALVEAVAGLHGPQVLQVRIGIATGLVVVGDLIGEGSAREQLVVGETPNLAARLQELARPGEVVVSAATRKLVGGFFAYRELGPIALKGLPEPVVAYQVLQPTAVQSRFEARQEGALAPLLGRTQQLDQLFRIWEQVKTGRGRTLLITGEPGIGKSRLAAALLQAARQTEDVGVRCFCLLRHEHTALHPITGHLSRAARFKLDDSPWAKLAKLDELLKRSQATDEELALISALFSLPHPLCERLAGMHPKRRKEKTFAAIMARGDWLAARGPLLVLWEDVHWIDATSLELLRLRVEQVDQHPMLLLITARPSFVPPWPDHLHVHIALNRLEPAAAAELVRHVAGGKELPADVLEQIVARSDGVPLFLEEMTKAVLESGLFDEEAGRYAASPLAARLAIPPTLQDSLTARIDRLSQWRGVIQIGAALGREFSYELLYSVAGLSETRLREALSELVRSELVSCHGSPPDSVYVFKHALVQDAAYATMLRGDRQELHARIVAVLEARFPGFAETKPEWLAQHCVEAGLFDKAIRYWHAAGRQALTRSTTEAAVALLHKGLTLLAEIEDDGTRDGLELDLRITLGQALSAAHGYASADPEAAYARARELCDRLAQPRQIVSVIYGQFLMHYHRCDLEWLRNQGEEACRLGKELDNPVLQWLGSRICGTRLASLGELPDARVYLERCLQLSEWVDREGGGALPPEGPEVGVLFHLGRVLACLGYPDQARSRVSQLIAEARRRPPLALFLALSGACFVDWCLRSASATCLQRIDELAAVSLEQGFAQGKAWANLFRGWCLGAMGNAQQAVALLANAVGEYRTLGITAGLPMMLTSLAEAHGMAGQPEAGLERLIEAGEIAEALQNRWAVPETLRLRGVLQQALGDGAAAEASFAEALTLARRQHAKLWEMRISASLARLWQARGEAGAARRLLAPVAAWFGEGPDTADLREARQLLTQDPALA